MKAEILKMLRESKEYVSGQQLCERLQVSRTAVWKVIKQLENEGYQIEAVRNRGYRIVECPDVLSQEEIESLGRRDRDRQRLIGRAIGLSRAIATN